MILGGTSEASDLARRLADDDAIRPTLSLAGRTAQAAPHGIATRIGGFGGVDGLADWLAREDIDAVIDATHPFAARISANAHAAATRLGIPLCTILRPAWQPTPEDCWTAVPDVTAAAAALGGTPRRVFLSIGRQGVAAFATAPQHAYLIRSIEAPDSAALPPKVELIAARGPFDTASETELLRRKEIDVIVSKNSGGAATYAKILAARDLGLPVIMIDRPPKAAGHTVATAADAYAWLQERRHGVLARSERGV